jgi:hypothetical protein
MNSPRFEWIAQLNVLSTILREHAMDVEELKIVALLRDWSKTKANRSQDYPPAPIVTLDIPLWSQEKAEEYIDERIRIHQFANRRLPECTKEKRWQQPDTFALIKKNRKRATKLFSSKEEAEEGLKSYGEEYLIDFRPGKPIRCESYCPVASFCEQHQKTV